MATPGINSETVLVTGSEGYIGAHLRKNLSFLGLDSRATMAQEKLQLDEFDPKDERYLQIRMVIHLADLKLHELSKENLQANIAGHQRFISKLSDLPRLENIVFSSSCSVYGASENIIVEESPVFPTSFYAESKLATEELFKQSGIPALIYRFGTAHGWSEQMRDDLFVNQLAKAVACSAELEIYSPDAWRPYIHCKDFSWHLADAISGFIPGTRNVVTENMTKRQILESTKLKDKVKFRISGKPDLRNYRVQQPSSLKTNPVLLEQSLQEMIEKYTYGKN